MYVSVLFLYIFWYHSFVTILLYYQLRIEPVNFTPVATNIWGILEEILLISSFRVQKVELCHTIEPCLKDYLMGHENVVS